ncbi:MAG: hypothetical protein DDT27_00692 [Dehalococcoidia bacterium]|nr:hypothetical protein [Chloroflexota bacterium]
MRHKLIIGCLLGLVVLMAAYMAAYNLFPKTDSKREEIISFTRQALEIEAERNDLVEFALSRMFDFRNGIFLQGTGVLFKTDPPLAGVTTLKSNLMLLSCPPSMSGVKDLLMEAYRLEIEAVRLDEEWRIDRLKPLSEERGSLKRQFYLEINRFNVSGDLPLRYDRHGPWIIAQKLRRDAYLKWVEILQEHDIDPAEEEFTAAPATTLSNIIEEAVADSDPYATWADYLGLPAFGRNPFQEWLADQFSPMYTAYLLSGLMASVDPAAVYEPPRLAEHLAGGPGDWRAQAPAQFAFARGLSPEEQERVREAIGGWQPLIHSLLRGRHTGRGAEMMAERVPRYRRQWEAAGAEGSFLDYLAQKMGL